MILLDNQSGGSFSREIFSICQNSISYKVNDGTDVRSILLEVFCKKVVKISQNAQENTCVGVSFLIKLQVPKTGKSF